MQHLLPDLPTYLPVVFGLTTLLTLGLFYLALSRTPGYEKQARWILLGVLAWGGIQSILTLNGFYNTNVDALPPKFPIGVIPPLLFMGVLFATNWGRRFLDALPLKELTWISVIRIPVEFVLYWLALGEAIPEIMTFAGRNFDIIAGITAPLVAYFGYQKGQMSKGLLIAWNVLCLGLLLTIVSLAVLALPTSFQQIAMDSPNVAVINFPYIWLPVVIVPIVMFTHFVSLRQLTRKEVPVAA